MDEFVEKLDALLAANQIKEAIDFACSLKDEDQHDTCLIIISYHCSEKGLFRESDEAESKMHYPLTLNGIG